MARLNLRLKQNTLKEGWGINVRDCPKIWEYLTNKNERRVESGKKLEEQATRDCFDLHIS